MRFPLQSELDADVLGLGKKFERGKAALAADAALAHAAEGYAKVAQEPAVDPDGAAVDCGGDAVGSLQVARPEARREAVLRRVRERDGLLFAVERRDRDDRTEDLLLQDAAVAPEAD